MDGIGYRDDRPHPMPRGYYQHRLWRVLRWLPWRVWCPLVHRRMHKLTQASRYGGSLMLERWGCRVCWRQWTRYRSRWEA